MPCPNNKDADQPVHEHSLMFCGFVVRCLDSLIPVVAIFKLPRRVLALTVEQACLSLTWSQIPQNMVFS